MHILWPYSGAATGTDISFWAKCNFGSCLSLPRLAVAGCLQGPQKVSSHKAARPTTPRNGQSICEGWSLGKQNIEQQQGIYRTVYYSSMLPGSAREMQFSYGPADLCGANLQVPQHQRMLLGLTYMVSARSLSLYEVGCQGISIGASQDLVRTPLVRDRF